MKTTRGDPQHRILPFLLAAILAATVLAVFAPVASYRFVDYDDAAYLVKNIHVRGGLDAEGVRWAFTTFRASNWHPLTWLSHMLDVELFGMNPGAHHLVSLALHTASTLLLFATLARMTGALWPSALTAALFGVHPLHVESVAWVAERKDVLSAFFWMLTLAAYLAYVRKPGRLRLAAVALALSLGLMAKPMLVTLPFVLLLLDFWPLGRTFSPDGPIAVKDQARVLFQRLLPEKLPLLVLCSISSLLTILAQRAAMSSLTDITLGARAANAAFSFASYLGKTFWPQGLSFFYPLRQRVPAPEVAGVVLVLGIISALILIQARRRPWLATGWFWYAGTLVPVSGLVQVGLQAMADRYTYLPLVGIFLALAWTLRSLVSGRAPAMRWAAAVAAATVVGILGFLARGQVACWRDTETLFRHGLQADPENYIALSNLGGELQRQGRLEEAVLLLERAIRARPGYAKSYSRLGTIRAVQGDLEAAQKLFRKAIDLAPGLAEAHNGLGVVCAKIGKLEEAYGHFREALRLEPEYAEAHSNLGLFFNLRGDTAAALESFRRAWDFDPGLVEAAYNLGAILLLQNRTEEAVVPLRAAVRLAPNHVRARFSLAQALQRLGRAAADPTTR